MANSEGLSTSEYHGELYQAIDRYDIEKLIDAASVSDWRVISKEEKREVEKKSSKQRMCEHFIKLLVERGRVKQFAGFILQYNSLIQNAALALLAKVSSGAGTADSRKEASCSSTISPPCSEKSYTFREERRKSSSSSTSCMSPMEIETKVNY